MIVGESNIDDGLIFSEEELKSASEADEPIRGGVEAANNVVVISNAVAILSSPGNRKTDAVVNDYEQESAGPSPKGSFEIL